MSNETAAAPVSAKAPDACAGKLVTGRDYGVANETVMRTAPDKTASPILRPGKPNDDKDAEVFATIDGSVQVREECRSGAWSNIRVLAPEHLRWMRGWVPSSDLRRVDVSGDGRRIYTAADIEWQAGSERYRKQILKVVNSIQPDDERCEAVDTASLHVAASNQGPSFTISCVGSDGTHAIKFEVTDATNGRSFAAVPTAGQGAPRGSTISKVDAVLACKAATLPQLSRPDAAEYHTFADVTFTETQAGARVRIGVTVRNFADVETAAAAYCEFKGAELIAATIDL